MKVNKTPSFSFTTYEGKGSQAKIPTRFDLSLYTLTLELDVNSRFGSPDLAGTVMYETGSIVINLSQEEVDTYEDAFYRVTATGNGLTEPRILVDGHIDYIPTPVVIKGDKGDTGTIRIGRVDTLAPGSDSTVVNVGTDTDAMFILGIPRGDKGDQGIQGIQGIQGYQGIQGLQGVQGPQGLVGPAGLEWKGVWNVSTAYDKDDAVYYDGSSWFSSGPITAGTVPSLDPGNDWQPLAIRGAQGVQGIQGIQGEPTDISGLQADIATNSADLTAATSLPTASTIMRRDINGGAQLKYLAVTDAPGGANAVARKDYVDAIGTTAGTINTIVRRDGNASFSAFQITSTASAPTNAAHYTRKDYVDTIGLIAPINSQVGTTYSFVSADTNRETHFNNAAAITATIPVAATLPAVVGQVLQIVQSGAGQVTITPASTVTVRAPSGYLAKTRAQDSKVVAKLSATNIWLLSGDLELATPTAASDHVRKDYVDAIGTNAATPSTIARRDASGDTSYNQVGIVAAAPTSAAQATRKDYVDARGGWQVAPAASTAGGAVPLTAFPFENTRIITLASNMTLNGTPTAPAAGRAGIVRIVLKQAAAGTGPFTVTWPAIATLPWSQGLAAPTMPTTAGAEQIIELLYTGSRWVASLVWTD